MKTLVAGPHAGEFGWELFVWQGYMRSLSKHFDKTTIVCRESSQSMYQDFASEFIFLEPATGLPDGFMMHGFDPVRALEELGKQGKIEKESFCVIPHLIGNPPYTHFSEQFNFGSIPVAQTFIQYGKELPSDYDFVFHARSRLLRREDNWSVENWNKLRDLLGGRIACIGTSDEALHIEETTDLRGIDLVEVYDVLRNATCVFGPSSGPMHLASLCGAPHVVWSIPYNRIRYERNWNPLDTPVLFLDEHHWHPSPEFVYERAREFILASSLKAS